jgi:hypothetical protein
LLAHIDLPTLSIIVHLHVFIMYHILPPPNVFCISDHMSYKNWLFLICTGEKVKGLVFCEATGPPLSLATFTDMGAIHIFKSVHHNVNTL